MIPDIEKVIGTYLRSHSDVVALGTRIVGETPKTIDDPWVRLTQINAPSDSSSRVDHLVPFYLQLDIYASEAGLDGAQQKEAALHGRTIRSVLIDAPDSSHADTQVTRVQVTSDARIPDTDIEPARERRILTAIVYAHAS